MQRSQPSLVKPNQLDHTAQTTKISPKQLEKEICFIKKDPYNHLKNFPSAL